MKKINILSLFLASAIGLATVSCKVEDPFLDRDVAPVLVDIVGAAFGAPLASEPAVTYYPEDSVLTLSARLLELDKTNILDYTKGIDSIPVPNVAIKISLRTGATLGEVTSDASGLVTLKKTWAEIGLPAPVKGNIVRISWSGSHNGIAFTRLSQISVGSK